MTFLRIFFSASLCLVSLTSTIYVHAEEALALNNPATDTTAPTWLPSARAIKIELIQEAASATPSAPAVSAAATPLALPPQLPAATQAPVAPQAIGTQEPPASQATAPITPAASQQLVTPQESVVIDESVLKPIGNEPGQKSPVLWERIRKGFAMRDSDNKLVAKHEKWYANHPDYFERMIERSRRYLYYITEEVERRGMPSEIALLPMIESAFNPSAYSHSRASGIWQFISSTGKKFGMQQNWWYDGRRDVISATNGALDYLQKLHDQFGDWELALAAYNCGEGGVERAQQRNRMHHQPTDYAHLKLLKETRNYVPKLLAIKNIIADPAKFSLTLQDIQNEPYFATVATGKHIDVKLAAQFAGISEEEFSALNPGHNRPVILLGTNDLILLPIDKVATFQSNMENYGKPLVSWQPYQPKKGERLDQLAPKFGLSVENLKSINGLNPRGSNISSGQTLLVPATGEENAGEFEAFNMHLAPNEGRYGPRHIIRRGETLGGLARRYHVSISRLKEWNGPLKILRAGQSIIVAEEGVNDQPHHRRARGHARKVAQNTTPARGI